MMIWDVLADGTWELFFTEKPERLTREEKRAWLDQQTGVSLGSDAFFPFGDNIERAHRSGVLYIAEAGGSIRDDHMLLIPVIDPAFVWRLQECVCSIINH